MQQPECVAGVHGKLSCVWAKSVYDQNPIFIEGLRLLAGCILRVGLRPNLGLIRCQPSLSPCFMMHLEQPGADNFEKTSQLIDSTLVALRPRRAFNYATGSYLTWARRPEASRMAWQNHYCLKLAASLLRVFSNTA